MDIETKPKVCVVHHCKNVSDYTQSKIFFKCPSDKILKEKWKMIIGGFRRPVSKESNIFVCQDHFDLHEDTSNYMDYWMSANEKGHHKIELKLKRSVVPHRNLDRKALENHEHKITEDYVELEMGSSDAENILLNSNKINIISNVRIDIDEKIATSKINNNIDKGIIRSRVISDDNFRFDISDKKTEIIDNKFLAMCKPVKVQILDLKYAVNPRMTSFETTDTLEINVDPIVRDMFLTSNELKQYPAEKTRVKSDKKRQLILKIFRWEQNQSQCVAICNHQYKTMEIYHFNSNSDITTYKSVITTGDFRKTLRVINFKGPKDRLKVINCCCWFNREKFRPLFEFTKRQHLCEIFNCSCCCRNVPPVSYNTLDESISMTQSSAEWVNKIVSYHRSLSQQKETFSAIQKAFIDNWNVRDKCIPVVNKEYESISIQLNSKYYKIVNGVITLHTTKEINAKPDINKWTCCWYSREKFADEMLTHNIHTTTIKFIRTPHLCLIKECKCCCKPKQNKNIHLPRPNMVVRHTNNISPRVRINISFTNKSLKLTHSQTVSTKFRISNPTTDIIPPVNKILPPAKSASERHTVKDLAQAVIAARPKCMPSEMAGPSSIVSKSINIGNVIESQRYPINDSSIKQNHVQDKGLMSIGQLTDIMVENIVQDSNFKCVVSTLRPRIHKCRATSPSRCKCDVSHLNGSLDSSPNIPANDHQASSIATAKIGPDIVASTSSGGDNTKPNPSNKGNGSVNEIINRLKNIHFINQAGGKLSARLGTQLNNLSSTELKILNNIMTLIANKLQNAGLAEEAVQLNLSNISNTMALKNENQKSNESQTNIVKFFEESTEGLTILKRRSYMESFDAFLKDQQAKNVKTFNPQPVKNVQTNVKRKNSNKTVSKKDTKRQKIVA